MIGRLAPGRECRGRNARPLGDGVGEVGRGCRVDFAGIQHGHGGESLVVDERGPRRALGSGWRPPPSAPWAVAAAADAAFAPGSAT